MLVSEVVDRTFNMWLYPSGINRPARDRLTSSVDASTLTIPTAGLVANVPADTVIEIDSEQMLVASVSGSTITIENLGRGWLETTATTHAINSIVWIDPKFTRQSVFNGLLSILPTLFPMEVYARKFDTSLTWDSSVPTKSLPTGGKKLLSISALGGGSVTRYNPLRPGIDYIEHQEFDPPKYELLYGGVTNKALQVVYAADFTLPTAETDNLSSLANPVSESLQPHLPMAIAGYLLQGREVPRVQIEDVRRMLASQGVQVGAAMNVGQSILNQFYGRYVAAERDRLKKMDSQGLEFVRR